MFTDHQMKSFHKNIKSPKTEIISRILLDFPHPCEEGKPDPIH